MTIDILTVSLQDLTFVKETSVDSRKKQSSNYSIGNNFSSLTGHVSFQIFTLVGRLMNLTGHN